MQARPRYVGLVITSSGTRSGQSQRNPTHWRSTSAWALVSRGSWEPSSSTRLPRPSLRRLEARTCATAWGYMYVLGVAISECLLGRRAMMSRWDAVAASVLISCLMSGNARANGSAVGFDAGVGVAVRSRESQLLSE